MKLIVGLGNIGDNYAKTRHNVGFMVVDAFAHKLGLSFNKVPKLFAEMAKNQEYILFKPQTFMNDSGKAVRAVCDYFQLDPATDLTVIHDDLDIVFGESKFQQGTGPKIHNGLGSIYQHLGTKDFLHVRVGIDGRAGDRSMPGSSYVLAVFNQEELLKLKTVTEQIVEKLLR
ncbi:MAG: aminoacyl-tRNA hydrolase [Candidatus Pacebacteria bacterium]|nr:aminoacyl-tRNA hydrolase [Candidatus Paceibacterota bacterium]